MKEDEFPKASSHPGHDGAAAVLSKNVELPQIHKTHLDQSKLGNILLLNSYKA